MLKNAVSGRVFHDVINKLCMIDIYAPTGGGMLINGLRTCIGQYWVLPVRAWLEDSSKDNKDAYWYWP